MRNALRGFMSYCDRFNVMADDTCICADGNCTIKFSITSQCPPFLGPTRLMITSDISAIRFSIVVELTDNASESSEYVILGLLTINSIIRILFLPNFLPNILGGVQCSV